MRKGFIVLMMVVVLILGGCQSKDIEKNEEGEFIYFGDYQMSSEGFPTLINENPIDYDYKKEFDEFSKSSDYTPLKHGEFELRYIEIWDKELNNTYNKLLGELSQENQELLKESQRGWLQYYNNEAQFVSQALYTGGYLGSQALAQIPSSKLKKIRERTFQLMEYRYILTGELEFLYGKK